MGGNETDGTDGTDGGMANADCGSEDEDEDEDEHEWLQGTKGTQRTQAVPRVRMSAESAMSATCGIPNTKHRTSNIEHRTSNIEHRTSNAEHRIPDCGIKCGKGAPLPYRVTGGAKLKRKKEKGKSGMGPMGQT